MFRPLLGTWQHRCAAGAQEQAWIPPDGCQDLVGIALPGGPVQWHVYALSSQAETIALPAGARLRGFRLAPGTQVNTEALLQRTHTLDLDDAPRATALLADTCTLDARVEESLQALVHAPSVTQAARSLCVSPRTLERLLHQHTAHPPAFWRSLARVRQTAHCLAAQPHWPLAEVAALHHWADQPHMNLAFRHWLGCTPRQLQRDPQRLGLLLQSGYGDQGLFTP